MWTFNMMIHTAVGHCTPILLCDVDKTYNYSLMFLNHPLYTLFGLFK